MVNRMWGKFERELFMIEHRRKMLPIVLRIKVRFRKRLTRMGPTFEGRLRKEIRNSSMAIASTCRPIVRERAKQTLLDFLRTTAEKAYQLSVFKRYLQRTICF